MMFLVRQIAREISQLVAEHYVFREVGVDLQNLIAAKASDDGYASSNTLGDFAAAITGDLQSINGDRHLRLLFTEEAVVDLADEEAELAMWTARADENGGGVAKVEILSGNVGFIALQPLLYPAALVGDRIAAAMTLLASTEALIIDVRDCIGGAPETVALFSSYLFDQPVHLNSMIDRSGVEVMQSWTLPWVPGRRFGAHKPVCVLTSSTTFSGGEELAYDLQQLGRAKIIGEQTGGGANPRQGFRVHQNLEVTIPVARPVNPVTGNNWELVGVTPDVQVESDRALQLAHDMLSA